MTMTKIELKFVWQNLAMRSLTCCLFSMCCVMFPLFQFYAYDFASQEGSCEIVSPPL